jgi:hypothetical protein
MENLLLIVIVFVAAMFAILAYVIVRNERDKEEFEHYMNDHPEIRYRQTHGHNA